MFDIGWTEIIVVIIVSCLLLDIKDIPSIIKTFKQLFKQFNTLIKEAKTFFLDIEQEAKIITKKVTDLEGNEQKAYDLDQIMPDIKESKDKNKDA
jgi:Sec-independent protein translocase protein TatA